MHHNEADVDTLRYGSRSGKPNNRLRNLALLTLALILPIPALLACNKLLGLESVLVLGFPLPSLILIAFMRARITIRIGLGLVVVFLYLAGAYVMAIMAGPWI